MKTKLILLLSFALLLCVGCQNSEVIEESVFFTGTERTPTAKVSVEGSAALNVTVTSTRKAANDKQIVVKQAPELLEEYNAKYAKSYQLLDPAWFDVSTDKVTIKSGSHVSDAITVNIKDDSGFAEATTYCLPLTITEVSDGTPVLNASRTVFVLVDKTIIRPVGRLSSKNIRAATFKNDPALKAVDKVTIETWVMLYGYVNSSPYISTIMGLEENFLLRVGDVTVGKARLQLAGRIPISATEDLSLNRWYHIAVVYDGSQAILYLDGKVNTSTPASVGPINLADAGGYDNGQSFGIGSSCGNRYLNGAICEMRIWSTARSQMEIENSKNYVDPTSEGLIAYWRFNEGTGNKIADVSGHGHDLSSSISWDQNVKFEN